MLANFGSPGRMREDFKSMRSIFESVKFLKNNAALAVSLSLLAAVSAQASPGKNSAVISAGVPRAVSQAGAPAASAAQADSSKSGPLESKSVFEGGKCIDIWKGVEMPGNACIKQEVCKGEPGRRWIWNVSKPRLEFFKPKTGKKTGLVIVCPGGAYGGLSADNEGGSVAKWLVEHGVAAAILWYRVPENMQGALYDILRAVRVARASADELGIDPNKICLMGFSAGANLCARASARYAARSYKGLDDIDKISARPDSACLIYPAYCDDPTFRALKIGAEPFDTDNPGYAQRYALAQNLSVNKNTPPAFIVQTLEDTAYVNASIAYFLALKDAGVDANLLLCSDGKHGYGLGLRNQGDLVSAWPQLFDKWLSINKYKGK